MPTITAAIDLREIALSEIDDSGRLRPVDMVAAEAIAASMARDGLLNPVDVCQLPGKTGYRLVAGGHRLAAAKLLGWEMIPGFVRSANALDRKAREIAENLFKADLGPIDRAAFVADLYRVEKLRAGMPEDGDGRAFSAAVKWKKSLKHEGDHARVMITHAYSLRDEVAAKIGMSVESVKKDLLLFKRLSASMAERVRGTVIGGNATALRQLASLDDPANPDLQRQVMDLIEGGQAVSVSQAVKILHYIRDRAANGFKVSVAQAVKALKVGKPANEKLMSTVLDSFSRLSDSDKKSTLRMLVKELPKGVTIEGVGMYLEAAE